MSLVASALVLAYVYFTSVEFKNASLIYFSLFTITVLVILNLKFFAKHWYVGIGLFVADFFLVTNPGVQAAYIVPASLVLLFFYLLLVPETTKVLA